MNMNSTFTCILLAGVYRRSFIACEFGIELVSLRISYLIIYFHLQSLKTSYPILYLRLPLR